MSFDPYQLFEDMAQDAGYVYCPACSSPNFNTWHPPGKHTQEGVIDMEGLTEGRIVHYVLPDGPSKGEHRPAIVVKVWRIQDYESGEVTGLPHPPENGCCNLQVFMDSDQFGNHNDKSGPTVWQTSVLYSEDKGSGTWHWIEKA